MEKFEVLVIRLLSRILWVLTHEINQIDELDIDHIRAKAEDWADKTAKKG